jgi:hypothetical protein
MAEHELPDMYADAMVLAHLRRLVISEILGSLSADDADRAISVAVQRLVHCLDEGPVPSVGRLTTPDRFRVIIDRVIDELRDRPDGPYQPKT